MELESKYAFLDALASQGLAMSAEESKMKFARSGQETRYL